MSNVLSLMSAAGRAPDPGPQLRRRVRLLSRGLALLLTALAALMLAVTVGGLLAALFYSGPGLRIGSSGAWIGEGIGPAGYVAFGSLPLFHRIVYGLVWVVRSTPAVAILWSLRALFRLYAKGVVFERANAALIRGVGLWLVVDALLPFLCHLLLSATGLEIDKAWLHFASFQELVLGALVFVIAEVMQVGQQIDEDRSQFV
jgi:hypothetical protein